METSCQETRGRLVGYADSEIDPAARAVVESHLRGCPACVEELEEIEKLRRLARELPGLASDPLQRQAILRAARQRISAPPRMHGRPLRLSWRVRLGDLVTAAALGVAVVLAVLLRTEHRAVPRGSIEVLTVAELGALGAGTPLTRTEIHLISIDGRGHVRPREEIR